MASPDIDRFSATTRDQAISRLAFCTYTGGSAWYGVLCHGCSAGPNGSSGNIRSPRTTHILPGCCVHFSTARSESRAEDVAYVGDRANRRHKPGRAFERLSYRFDILADYGYAWDEASPGPAEDEHRVLGFVLQRLSSEPGPLHPRMLRELVPERRERFRIHIRAAHAARRPLVVQTPRSAASLRMDSPSRPVSSSTPMARSTTSERW